MVNSFLQHTIGSADGQRILSHKNSSLVPAAPLAAERDSFLKSMAEALDRYSACRAKVNTFVSVEG